MPDDVPNKARISVAIEIRRLLRHRDRPVLVAMDGPSGSGKSTLASFIVEDFGGVLVQGDDFFSLEITNADWDSRIPAARADGAIDWRRLRALALEPLLAGQTARWHAFDFASGPCPDGTWQMQSAWTERLPAALIVLDGTYSTRPELVDLVSLSVLVQAPPDTRRMRLGRREDPAVLALWHARWDAAEAYYFERVRPPASFDLVVAG